MERTTSASRPSAAQKSELFQTTVISSAAKPEKVHAGPDDLPLDRAYYWERIRGSELFLTQPLADEVRNWTWAEAMAEARRIAAWLKTQPWPPGSHIVILSRNSAWWIMAELAIWMSGFVTVPIYTSLTIDSARQLIAHCDPVACFLGALDNPQLLPETIAPQVTTIRFPNAPASRGALDWQRLVDENAPLRSNPVRLPDDLATIIYTSGTTGAPKGALHRFAAFGWFARAVTQVTGTDPSERVLSYLPLAHIAERALTETASLYCGWHMFFSHCTATFLADLKRARPTVFFSVPRLYAKFQTGVLERIPPRRLNFLLRVPLLNRFVRRRILAQLGLGSVRIAASGSAPLAPDLLAWYRRLGLPLVEGYGTTEAGITHTAAYGQGPAGTVGRSAPGVSTRISPQGEVQVSSPMNMLGYYKDLHATRAAFTDDGFLQTGDLGEQDPAGWLKIAGRVKEQFKTSKGEYVLPSTIEGILNAHNALECSLVSGEGLPAPFAVAVLSADARRMALNEAGRAKLAASLESLVEQTNARLAPHERLKFLALTADQWTIAAGFLTPTLKLKRRVLEEHYAPFVRDWMARNTLLVWHTEYN